MKSLGYVAPSTAATFTAEINIVGGDRNPANFATGPVLAVCPMGSATPLTHSTATLVEVGSLTGTYLLTVSVSASDSLSIGNYVVRVTTGTVGSPAISYVGNVVGDFVCNGTGLPSANMIPPGYQAGVAGSTAGNFVFSGSTVANAGVTGDAIFFNTASTGNDITGNAYFYDESQLNNSVSGNAAFFGTSSSSGANVVGIATFNDNSFDNNSDFGGTVIFNDSSSSGMSQCSGSLVWNSVGTFTPGTIGGNLILLKPLPAGSSFTVSGQIIDLTLQGNGLSALGSGIVGTVTDTTHAILTVQQGALSVNQWVTITPVASGIPQQVQVLAIVSTVAHLSAAVTGLTAGDPWCVSAAETTAQGAAAQALQATGTQLPPTSLGIVSSTSLSQTTLTLASGSAALQVGQIGTFNGNVTSALRGVSFVCTEVIASSPIVYIVGLNPVSGILPVAPASGDTFNISQVATGPEIANISAGGGATAAEVWTYGTRTLTSVANLNVVISNPVVQGVNLSIYQGAAYDANTNQTIQFNDPGTWPVMTGGGTQLVTVEVQCVITAVGAPTASLLALQCVVTGTSPNQIITIPATSAQTASLPLGDNMVHAVVANVNKPTNTEIRELITGSVQVSQLPPITW